MTESTEDMEPTLATFMVTCHTEGCTNAEITLELLALADSPSVMCGVCAQPITDVVAVNATGEELP